MKPGKSIRFDSYGDVEVLRYETQPKLRPGRGEILVEVVAAALNHMDIYLRAGAFQDLVPLVFPASQGSCFSGIVRAVGAGVEQFRVGDEVVGHDPAHAAHANRVVVAAGAAAPKPKEVRWEVAGALYLAGTTAWSTIDRLRLGPGDTVLISAAAGGVGHLECQLARLTGARVIGIAGGENSDYLRSIDVIPVAHGARLEEEIGIARGGRPVTAFVDNYGRYEGLAASLGVPETRFSTSEQRRDCEIRFFTAPGDDPEPMRILSLLLDLIVQWKLEVLISGFYAFDDLPRAVIELDALHSRGRVIVGMNTSAPSANYSSSTLRAHHDRVGD